MDPMPIPPPDDRMFTDFGNFIGAHLWSFLTTVIAFVVGLIWRASSERQNTLHSIKDNRDILDKHDVRITALEQGAVAIAVKIGELPTRGELVAQTAALDARFDRLDMRLDGISHPSRSS